MGNKGNMLQSPQLSPFAHELDRYGEDCVSRCPACRWVEEQRIEKLRAGERYTALARLGKDIAVYGDCELFQIGLEELRLV